MPQNFPALRAHSPKTEEKAHIFPRPGPGRLTTSDQPDFPTHIQYVSTALFCSLAKPRAGRTSLTDVIKSKVKRHGRHGV